MLARADAAAATGDRILDAAVAVFWELPTDQISLNEVAGRAGVTVQTVIRRFGGRQGLIAAAMKRETARVRAQRGSAPAGDVTRAVELLVNHYEELGDRVIKMLAEEFRNPALHQMAEHGRAVHRAWCERVFAPTLARLPARDRRRRLAQLIAVCDVYTWSLLSRQAGLSRRETELALVELLKPIVEGD